MRTELLSENEENISQLELKNKILSVLPVNSTVCVKNNSKKRVIIMVTKEAHCLGDILFKQLANEINIEIVAVIGNYSSLQNIVEKFDIPFYEVSHENLNREEHAEKVSQKLDDFEFDFIILAKYMRILPPFFVKKYEHKIINIHHSFLPAFIGANPYKQAHKRGVKLIGATAHYVTNDLDEGPIIEQNVINIDHTFGWREMQKAGRDVEKTVLSKAIELVTNDRVFIYQNKTVIL
jgi:formyltetrahydrofolate deformylase